jgi:hypothetical protein
VGKVCDRDVGPNRTRKNIENVPPALSQTAAVGSWASTSHLSHRLVHDDSCRTGMDAKCKR